MTHLKQFNFDQMVSEKEGDVEVILKGAVLLDAISKEIKNAKSEFIDGTLDSENVVVNYINQFTNILMIMGVESHFLINSLMVQGFFSHIAGINKIKNEECVIYAIYSTETGLTKIGRTTRFNERMKELQSISPSQFKIILKISAPPTLETELHRQYVKFRRHGEWFQLDEKMRNDLVEKVRDKGGRISNPS